MSSSSARRGQTEPLAALAAVFVVGLALTGYAATRSAVGPPPTQRERARPTLYDVAADLTAGAVAVPGHLAAAATGAAPPGYAVNVTLRAAGRSWHFGEPTPRRADAATRLLPVRLAPGRVRPGRLRVVVWR